MTDVSVSFNCRGYLARFGADEDLAIHIDVSGSLFLAYDVEASCAFDAKALLHLIVIPPGVTGYGLECYNPDGNITLSLVDQIARFVYIGYVSGGVDGSVDLPEIDGHTTLEFAYSITGGFNPHKVSRSGTTISWDSIDIMDFSGDSSYIFVLMID